MPVVPDWTLRKWRRFLLSEGTREKGGDSYDDVFRSALFPLQRRRELNQVMRLVRPRAPRVVCEIGASRGGSIYHWIKCLPSVSRMIAAEVGPIPYKELFEHAFPEIDFRWLERGSRHKVDLERLRPWLGRDTIDVLFVDGQKGAYRKDFALYLPLMAQDGIVLFHDVNGPAGRPTTKAFREIARRGYKSETIVDTSEVRDCKGREDLTAYEKWVKHWNGESGGVGVIYLERTGP